MGGSFITTRARGTFAAFVVLAALAPAAIARADQMAIAPPPPSFDVVAPSKHMLDFDAVKRSTIRNSGKFDNRKHQSEPSGVALPDRVDLGGSMLRFDADRSAVSRGPRVGVESHDPSFLSRSTRKDEPGLNYFGLTLTTPTH